GGAGRAAQGVEPPPGSLGSTRPGAAGSLRGTGSTRASGGLRGRSTRQARAGRGTQRRGVVLEQHQARAVRQVGAPVDRIAEGKPEAQPAPLAHAFASSSSFFRTSATFCAASGGTSWYT